MDIKEIRRKNLRLLSEKFGGQKPLAEAADLAANQLNHIIGPNPIRNLGEQLARKIEANVGLPLGSLDIPSESSAQYLSNLDVENSTFINALSIKVPFNSNECLFENIREGIVFTKRWAASAGLGSEGLFEYQMDADNMAALIKPGDYLAVDTSQREIEDGAIYLLILNNKTVIKRIFRLLNNNIRLTNDSQNKIQYPDLDVLCNQIPQLTIIGKIVAHQRSLPL